MEQHSGDNSANGAQTLLPREQARLVGILSRLSSPYDNERATAGLLAVAFIAKHNLTWSDLIGLLRPIPSLPEASDDPPPRQDRRWRKTGGWRGYCRRRSVKRGTVIDVST